MVVTVVDLGFFNSANFTSLIPRIITFLPSLTFTYNQVYFLSCFPQLSLPYSLPHCFCIFSRETSQQTTVLLSISLTNFAKNHWVSDGENPWLLMNTCGALAQSQSLCLWCGRSIGGIIYSSLSSQQISGTVGKYTELLIEPHKCPHITQKPD